LGEEGWPLEWCFGFPAAWEFSVENSYPRLEGSHPRPSQKLNPEELVFLRVQLLGVEDDLRTLTPQIMEEITSFSMAGTARL